MGDSSFGPKFHICSYLHSYAQAAQNDSQVWWTSENETWSKSTLYKRVVALSTALTAAGIKVGERVALIAPGTCRFLESVLGITSAGAICAPINTKWSAAEVAAALQLVQPSLIITHASLVPLAMQAFDGCTGLSVQLMVDGATSELTQPRHACVKRMLDYQRCIDAQLLAFNNAARLSPHLLGSVNEQAPGSLVLGCDSHHAERADTHTTLHADSQPAEPRLGSTWPQIAQHAQHAHHIELRSASCGNHISSSTDPKHGTHSTQHSAQHLVGDATLHSLPLTTPSSPDTAQLASSRSHSDSASTQHLISSATAPSVPRNGQPRTGTMQLPCSLVSPSSHPGDARSHANPVPLSCIPPLPLMQPPDDAALICFTSGTTGTPKGVVLSHAAFHTQSLVKLAMVGYCSSDVYLHLAPLYHIGGLSSALAVLMVGGKMVFLPRYSAAAAYDLIKTHQVTAIIAVPTMLKDFVALSSQSADPSPLPSMQRLLVGAGSMPPPLQAAARALFPNAAIMTAYGMSEACSSITFHTITSPFRQELEAIHASVQKQHALSHLLPNSQVSSRPGAAAPSPQIQLKGCGAELGVDDTLAAAQPLAASQKLPTGATRAGWPAPGILVRVVKESEREGAASSWAEEGQDVGEVQTQGPHLMSYYWGDSAQTMQAFTTDGWLRTGDMGCLDPAGCLWLVGRKKDMIKSGGENVFAAEVEAVLAQHPAVRGVAVVGLPHDRLGESVCALLELHPGTSWQGLFASSIEDDGVHIRDQRIADSGVTSHTGRMNSTVTAPHSSTASSTPHKQDPSMTLSTHVQSETRNAVKVQMVTLSELVLQDHCRRAGLSAYKLPRFMVAQYAAMPVNSSGKVLKHEVKAVLLHARAVVSTPRSRL